MAKSFAGLKSFGSKAVSVVASGALALSLTPAIALANTGAGDLQAQATNLATQHYEPNNTTNLKVIGTSESGDAVELVSSSNGEYVYKGFAHGDQAHYGSYSLYTHLKTDGKGTLTGINLTSDVDTFYSKWGKYMQKTTSYYGYLPNGVTFSFDKERNVSTDSATGKTTVNVELSGAKSLGVAAVTATFYAGANAKSIGTDVNASSSSSGGRGGSSSDRGGSSSDRGGSSSDRGGSSGSGGGWSRQSVEVSTQDDAVSYGTDFDAGDLTQGTVKSTATFTNPEGAASVNLVAITYQIGYDKTKFIAYACLDDDANAWADAAEAGMIDFKAEKGQPTSDTGLTNRDRWSYYMLSQVAQRELRGYAAYLKNKSDANALSGIDVVSGATKTSEPFKAAIEDAVAKGYITAIDENLSLTFEQGASDEVDIAKQGFSDQTTVVKNADGTYTLDIAVPTNASYDMSDSHSPAIQYVMTYALGKSLSSEDMLAFAQSANFKERTGVPEAVESAATLFSKDYQPTKIYGNGYAAKSNEAVADAAIYNAPFADSASGVKWELGNTSGDAESKTLKVTDYKMTVPADTTQVLVAIHIGHAFGYVAYDLANMVKVNPVVEQISALTTTSDESTVKAARAAYDALPYDVQGFVTNISKLTAAEEALASSAATTTSVTPVVKKGDAKTVSGQTYKVTKVASAKAAGAVTLTKAKNAKSVTVPASVKLADGKTYKVTAIAASSFAKSKATKVTVKTTTFKKANVKNCFKGSKVATVKVPAKNLSAYKKIFTKKITSSAKALKVTK